MTERDRLDLRGLLPPNVMSSEQQIERFSKFLRYIYNFLFSVEPLRKTIYFIYVIVTLKIFVFYHFYFGILETTLCASVPVSWYVVSTSFTCPKRVYRHDNNEKSSLPPALSTLILVNLMLLPVKYFINLKWLLAKFLCHRTRLSLSSLVHIQYSSSEFLPLKLEQHSFRCLLISSL